MTAHRWSGWPGAWCLDCGVKDQVEAAIASGNFVCIPDDSEAGFALGFPGLKIEPCPHPGEGLFDPSKAANPP